MKHLFLLVTCLYALNCYAQGSQTNTNKTPFNEPYYLVDFTASLCNFEVKINGMQAFSHIEGGTISSHMPINHLILESGIQSIYVNLLPLEGEHSPREDGSLTVKVFCYDAATNTLEVFKYERPDFSDDKLVAAIVGEFNAEVNYKVDGWKHATPFESIDKDDVVSYYKSIHALFHKKSINAIFDLMKDKFAEVDISMYLENEDNKKELHQLFNTIDEGGFVLEDFPDSTQLILYADKKVCSLMSAGGQPIVYYRNNKTNEEFSFPIYIVKRNRNYHIIR